MASKSSNEAAPLTPETVTEAVKEVDWGILCRCLCVPDSKRDEIQKHYPAKDHQRVLVDWWFSTDPAPSWRRLIHQLDYGGEKGYSSCSKTADKIRCNAEPVEDTTFTLQNVTTAVESVDSQGSLGFYLGVPRRKYRSGKEIIQYFIATVPRASWETLAGGLYHREEQAALKEVTKYFQPQPEATLTVANLCTALGGIVEWDDLGRCLGVPHSKQTKIRMKYSTVAQCKQAMLAEWRSHHPAPSWMLVANALYGVSIRGKNGKYHKVLQLVKEKYLKVPAATVKKELVSSTPLSPPPASVIDGPDADALLSPQRGAVISPLSSQPPPPALKVSTLEVATLPEQPVSSTGTPPISSATPDKTEPHLCKIKLADLEFMSKIGAGGYGQVWMGRWKSKDKIVAIKKVMELQKREIHFLSLLDHPNVIQYYGTATGPQAFMGHFIITEFAENGSISDYIHQKHQQPTLTQSLLWARQVAEGMQYIHDKNIIHRDLKSSNVVLTATLTAKICDLGSARSLQHTVRQSTMTGTYPWMAPEMVRREPVSKTADVYSYGIFLWEIITQKVPFSDVKSYNIPAKIAAGEHPTIPDSCEPYIADLLNHCWQKPKARPVFKEILKALDVKEPQLCEIELADLEFMENIGVGGFGEVWKGRWKSTKRIVAIKKVMDPEKQLKREIGILSLLDHPNVIQYYGTATGQQAFMGYFTVTEFAENGSIYGYIHQKHRQPTLKQSLLWARQVAEGMQYIHSRNIIHRNLKSSNVVLTSTLKAKICDLGSAQSLKHTTRQTIAVGTVAWMAPEMLRMEKVSKSCDVYSYGVLLFEIATQQLPFPDVLPIMVPGMIAQGKRPTIPVKCDSHLADLIKRCWKEDAKARPAFEKILVSLSTITN